MQNIVSILLRLPALFILAVSWILSSKEIIPYMPSFYAADKLVHFVCFGALAASITWWVKPKLWTQHFWFYFTVCVISVLLYGIIDEIHQSFVIGRTASAFDVLADTIGGAFGSFLGGNFLCLIYHHKNK